MSDWLDRFAAYRTSVTEPRIDRWLDQFESEHRDVAARLLDVVEFFPHEFVSATFRSLAEGLPGWDKRRIAGSVSRWRFAAFSRTAGESGDAMLTKFRHGNSLDGLRYDRNFIQKSQIVSERLGRDDRLVLVDDFAGTGDQAVDSWQQTFSELTAGVRTHLVYLAATQAAMSRISSETDLRVVAGVILDKTDQVFAEECSVFEDDEKAVLLEYGRRANASNPMGHGDLGLTVVFAHRCPNNSLPVLHMTHDAWTGLFPRH
jgi:hypothetical protein